MTGFHRSLFVALSSFCISFVFVACAPEAELRSAVDESGFETATVLNGDESVEIADLDSMTVRGQKPAPVASDSQRMILNQAMTVRAEVANVLEGQAELPAGTQIEVPLDYSTKNLDYRDSNGQIVRSSTGFIYPIRVVSVPEAFRDQFTQDRIDQLNAVYGGLFIFASIIGDIQGTKGDFLVIKQGKQGAGFLTQFRSNGRPKFNYTNQVKNRFAKTLNKGVDPQDLSEADRQKWRRIYAELKRVANRTVATPKTYLMIESEAAKRASLAYENSRLVPMNGAWTIAVQHTAVRHGFGNVPCAEFQSEIVREAYQRAGYRVMDDFNARKGNELIWSNTAAVVRFSAALNQAGWIPWDAAVYKPIVGAVLMNGAGKSPGHTYIAANDGGTIIVDNGAPQGRDLYKTSEATIKMMFHTGVFFLPPGINPPVW